MLRSLVILTFLAGCATEPPPPPVPGAIQPEGAVVLTADGTEITENMVDAITRRVPPAQLEQMKASGQYDQFLRRMAVGQVLYDKAIEQGIHEKEDVKMVLAMSARETLASELVRAIGEEAVTDDKVQAYYDERKVQYARPQVQARHILVDEKSLADDLAKQLREGADFATLAQQYSKDPGSKDKGGDLGWFEKERMIGPFAEAAFSAEVGKISDPVETRFGYHVIEVLDKRDSTPLEEVRDQIEQSLEQEAVQTYMKEIEASVKIDMDGAAGGDDEAPDIEPETTPPAEPK